MLNLSQLLPSNVQFWGLRRSAGFTAIGSARSLGFKDRASLNYGINYPDAAPLKVAHGMSTLAINV